MIRNFLFLAILLIFFSSNNTFASETFFSDIYKKISTSHVANNNNYPEKVKETANRVGEIIGVSSDTILNFIYNEQLETYGENILDTCSPKNQSQTLLTADSCINNIRKIWNKELDFVEKEEFIKSNIFLEKYFDGKFSEDGSDFGIDIIKDIETIKKQLFDKGILEPEYKLDLEDLYNLSENDYRLSSNSVGFSSSGGCEKNETSIYGGLVCIPEFCSDFMCVKITATPGRKSSIVKGKIKSTTENLINANLEVCRAIKDLDQKTPTRNSSVAHWWSQIFDFQQLLKGNIIFQSKTPPIIKETVPFDDFDSNKKPLIYSYNFEKNEFEVKEVLEKKQDKIQGQDLQKVHFYKENYEQNKKSIEIEETFLQTAKDLGICKDKKKCQSINMLNFFNEDCSMLLSRGEVNTVDNWHEACFKDKKKEVEISGYKSLEDRKSYFDDNMSEELNSLWGDIIKLEKTILGLSIENIDKASNYCGSTKIKKGI